ncbi:glycine cleavage system protein GcvH [Deinococcus sp. Marseille-Q6407]|uniref:glycine cleavage system protein GcvH n=1 Tax=Deinococcus sp. Marseille-Q6407 TaxID=2969223 RepID=UPI0021C18DB3|nr:glycine cleavage system protein GcvH [Deinococcus sp. Marseille-Q6407]
MTNPTELKYAPSHEWLAQDGKVGITQHAQDQLGDVVYVELPEVGREVEAGEAVAVVESVKTASDIYAPASGTIKAVNEELEGSPELVNEAPFEGGWLFQIEVTAEGDNLMDADAYAAENG